MYPKISVIIAVYNGAKVIEKSVGSFLNQNYGNKELVIVDGGSTDGTVSIIKQFDNPSILWKSEPDKGVYDAMNKGIERATGEWIYFLGADDEFYNREVLASLFGGGNFEGIDFLYGNVKREGFKKVYDGEFDYRKLLIKNISHQAIFYRKNIFQQLGNYNVNFKTHADWDFNLRCFEKKEISIKYRPEVIARFGQGGLSSSYDLPFFRNSLLPRKLSFLENESDRLFNLKSYDEWWRFIRNSQLRSERDVINAGYHYPLPGVILSMVITQSKLPESLLKKGLFSKLFMFINYLSGNHKLTH
jgi:glycosyltransferase involved in cell wall biosynthesis